MIGVLVWARVKEQLHVDLNTVVRCRCRRTSGIHLQPSCRHRSHGSQLRQAEKSWQRSSRRDPRVDCYRAHHPDQMEWEYHLGLERAWDPVLHLHVADRKKGAGQGC